MLRFFGQPIFRATDYDNLPVSYELLIREQNSSDEAWHLPADFSAITVDELEPLLVATINAMPDYIERVGYNLEVDQFVNPAFIDMATRVQHRVRVHMITEITERPNPNVSADELFEAARVYTKRGLAIVIDDVGIADNSLLRINLLRDFTEGYKFALQNLRPFTNVSCIKDTADMWGKLISHDKLFAFEGIETKEEAEAVATSCPYSFVQGYFFGKPALLPMTGNVS